MPPRHLPHLPRKIAPNAPSCEIVRVTLVDNRDLPHGRRSRATAGGRTPGKIGPTEALTTQVNPSRNLVRISSIWSVVFPRRTGSTLCWNSHVRSQESKAHAGDLWSTGDFVNRPPMILRPTAGRR